MIGLFHARKGFAGYPMMRAGRFEAVIAPGIGSSKVGSPAIQRKLLALGLDKAWDRLNIRICGRGIQAKGQDGAGSC